MKHNCFNNTAPIPLPKSLLFLELPSHTLTVLSNCPSRWQGFCGKQQQVCTLSTLMCMNSLYSNTVALKMNFKETDKGSWKLQESLYSLLHSMWKRLGCRVWCSGFSHTSPGDVLYHKLPNFAQSKETALLYGVQMQLSFDFSALHGSTGAERGSCHDSLLLLPQQMSERAEAGNAARPAATEGWRPHAGNFHHLKRCRQNSGWQSLNKLIQGVTSGRGIWVWYFKLSQDFIAWGGCLMKLIALNNAIFTQHQSANISRLGPYAS